MPREWADATGTFIQPATVSNVRMLQYALLVCGSCPPL